MQNVATSFAKSEDRVSGLILKYGQEMAFHLQPRDVYLKDRSIDFSLFRVTNYAVSSGTASTYCYRSFLLVGKS